MKKIWIIFLSIITLTGCVSQKSINKPTSYDGDYFSYNAIIEDTNEILFTIENGYVKGKVATGIIDEKAKTYTDNEELKSTFTYDKGELIINTPKRVIAYRKNSPAYYYINEVYGEYNQNVKPQLIKIISFNYLQFLEGNYTRQSQDINVSKINIVDNQFIIYYSNDEPTKYLNFNFDSVTIDEPNWDKDQILSIDEALLKTYKNCSTIEDIVAISSFDIKLIGEDQDKQLYNIIVSCDGESRNIVLQKRDDSKNNWIDNNFNFTK